MNNEELLALDRRHLWHPFTQEKTAPAPVVIAAGRGAWLETGDGRHILDLISSWWVTTHGHGHPAIAQAVARQAQCLEQVIFAGFTHRPAALLGQQLTRRLPDGLNRLFFSDDGSTAVEVSLKMACQYWRNRGESRHRFAVLAGGYHGDTVGAMSAGKSSGFFDAFQEMLFQVDAMPYPETWMDDDQVEEKEARCLQTLADYLARHGRECAALLAEPLVQGASGMRMCRPVFLQGVARLLVEHGVLLILDEVMTGFGRTGAMFASQRAGVVPDIICLSKGLTGGFLPMSVTVCREEIYQAFWSDSFDQAFAHGHSFTANPLGCAAALASLELFETEDTLARVAAMEAIHLARLQGLRDHPKAHRLRVTGSIAALDVRARVAGYGSEAAPRLKAFFLERGLLIRPLGNVVYLMPPYCLTARELHQAWDGIDEALAWLLSWQD